MATVTTAGDAVSFTLPLRVRSLTNAREHWSKRARLAKRDKVMVWRAWLAYRGPKLEEGATAVVKLSRIAPRTLDDDNLPASLKSIRDGVADCLGIDDGSPRVKWEYEQRRGTPLEYAVCVEVTTLLVRVERRLYP